MSRYNSPQGLRDSRIDRESIFRVNVAALVLRNAALVASALPAHLDEEECMASSKLPEGDVSFSYFPDNYRWSHGMLLPLGGTQWGGGEIDEINRVGLRLKGCVGDDKAWFDEWA